MRTFYRVIGHIVGGMIALVGALAMLAVIGMMIEEIGEHQEQRERCLKKATNGYEIERCR